MTVFAREMRLCAKGHAEICFMGDRADPCLLCVTLDELGAANDRLAEFARDVVPAERERMEQMEIEQSICGFCDQGGADKVPHPVRWPGENSAGTEYVHRKCEDSECRRAHKLLTDDQRSTFLRALP